MRAVPKSVMNASDLDRLDPTFPRDVLESQKNVAKVCEWLAKLGVKTKQPPIEVRDRPENMREYSDSGDFFIWKERWIRCEAKKRTFEWSDREPYPYEDLMVCNVHNWDMAVEKPKWIFLTNDSETWCYIVPGSTRPTWTKRKVWDRVHNRYRHCYFCPLDLGKLRKMS